MGRPVNEVESMMDTSAQDMVEDALSEVDMRVAFDWTSSPSLRDIELEVYAAEETWGAWPELIIVDSLYNVRVEEGDDYSGMRTVISSMHDLARETGACVVVLHHASLNRSKEDEPAGMSAIIGQVSALPELVLSVMLDEDDHTTYRVGIVKNRSGEASAKGGKQVRLAVDVPRMRLYNDEGERHLALTRSEWE
jgi:hypothetical protein